MVNGQKTDRKQSRIVSQSVSLTVRQQQKAHLTTSNDAAISTFTIQQAIKMRNDYDYYFFFGNANKKSCASVYGFKVMNYNHA